MTVSTKIEGPNHAVIQVSGHDHVVVVEPRRSRRWLSSSADLAYSTRGEIEDAMRAYPDDLGTVGDVWTEPRTLNYERGGVVYNTLFEAVHDAADEYGVKPPYRGWVSFTRHDRTGTTASLCHRGSLREAVEYAYQHPDDEVEFSPGVPEADRRLVRFAQAFAKGDQVVLVALAASAEVEEK